jgi:hypothetical protein
VSGGIAAKSWTWLIAISTSTDCLIIVGTTVLGIAASNLDWPQLRAALTIVIAGIAAFVGPIAAWAAAGIGLSIGSAAATAWLRAVGGRGAGFIRAFGAHRLGDHTDGDSRPKSRLIVDRHVITLH